MDEFKEVISQLELERSTMSRRVDKLQRELINVLPSVFLVVLV